VETAKSIYSDEYAVFLAELRAARREAGLTQQDVATRLRQTQSFVSKCERGERRVDIVELRRFCHAIGIAFPTFARRLEEAIGRDGTDSFLEQ
jgi:transcriptional regulator with XRE-family HTH domain